MKQNRLLSLPQIVLFLVLISFIFNCSGKEKKINDWTRMNLKNKIQQIDEVRYATYQDLIDKKEGEKSFIRFNTKGLITKNATYMNKGQIHWLKYIYNKDSVWIREVRELANNSEHPQVYWLYKVNEQGAQYAVTSYLLDSSVNFHIDLELNNDGNPTEINYSQQRYPAYVPCRISNIYGEDGLLKEVYSYQYNDSTKKCFEEGTLSKLSLNSYGDLEREVIYQPDGQRKVHSYKYKYDSLGNWTEKQHYYGDFAEEVIFRSFTYYGDTVKVD